MHSPGASPEPVRAITSAEAAHTMLASFLGWALDAFDFFILIFVMPAVAREFHRPISPIAFTITATLALRPLAAAAFFFVFPHYGWRAMFFLGGAPALLTIYIRSHVPESEAWQRTRPDMSQIRNAIRANWKLFLYLCVLMTMMNFASHGTQDMYPTFLEKERGFDTRTVATIAVIYNVGALLGGLIFGYLSDHVGRRRAMAIAVICAGLAIPLWIYPGTLAFLTLGASLMQFMVQGAWGVIPAHLTELSPPEVRGLFSGLAYQTGVLVASGVAVSQALLAERFGYAATLAGVAAIVMVCAAVVILLGRERLGRDLHSGAAGTG